MINSRAPIVAGNWKMNLDHSEALTLTKDICSGLTTGNLPEIVIAPSFTSIHPVSELLKNCANVSLAAQNMYWEDSGAFTGEISALMLTALDVKYVILGHSERRHIIGENNEQVAHKVEAAFNNGLIPILCVGETLDERNSGLTEQIIRTQLEAVLQKTLNKIEEIVIAYEPVWAIGTGKTAEPRDANDVAAFIRQILTDQLNGVANKIRIQYGGSVTTENVDEIMSMPEIDGVLVGGASLKANSFLRIINYNRLDTTGVS